ncbi:hypothetical protein D9615_007038 [Tricholomella constricta]|uniref:Uncharacterized protein n=1 Tax=Tricholomella constricta TaxID=117010 RepID=A0A8H5H8E8_9AGAR|nr:hypothetical protein D9615_007038 [Tricholomella constricta]
MNSRLPPHRLLYGNALSTGSLNAGCTSVLGRVTTSTSTPPSPFSSTPRAHTGSPAAATSPILPPRLRAEHASRPALVVIHPRHERAQGSWWGGLKGAGRDAGVMESFLFAFGPWSASSWSIASSRISSPSPSAPLSASTPSTLWRPTTSLPSPASPPSPSPSTSTSIAGEPTTNAPPISSTTLKPACSSALRTTLNTSPGAQISSAAATAMRYSQYRRRSRAPEAAHAPSGVSAPPLALSQRPGHGAMRWWWGSDRSRSWRGLRKWVVTRDADGLDADGGAGSVGLAQEVHIATVKNTPLHEPSGTSDQSQAPVIPKH